MSRIDNTLSVIIPTRNRSAFVQRLLSYYAGCDFKCTLVIGDSSEDDQRQRMMQIVESFRGSLRIHHILFPVGSRMYPVSYELLKSTSTPYVALLADDDFLTPHGLEEAVNFLELHPDYSIAHGMSALIKLNSSGPYGTVEWSELYGPASIEQEEPQERLAAQFKAYNTASSVHRRQVLEEGYRQVVGLGFEAKFAELLTQSLNVIYGKTKRLNVLYLIRQAHPGQDSVRSAKTHDIFEWLVDPKWHRHYEGFLGCLVSELSIRQRIQSEEAQRAIERTFWFYLAHGLKKGWKTRYAGGERSGFLEVLQRYKGMRMIWHRIRAVVPGMEPEMSLPALLRSSSRFHADFMPISKVVSAASTNGRISCAWDKEGREELVSSTDGTQAHVISG